MHGIEDMIGMLRLVYRPSKAAEVQKHDQVFYTARPKDEKYDPDDVSKVPDNEPTFTAAQVQNDPKSYQKLHEKYTGLDLYVAVGKLSRTDSRRYYVLRPNLFAELIMAYQSKSKAIMSKCYPVLADMLILARSYTSRLNHSGRTDGILDMGKYIKGHSYITWKLDFPPHDNEEMHFQFLHLQSALDYDKQIAGPKGESGTTSNVVNPAIRTRKKSKGGAFATRALRQLAILTTGVVPGSFDARARAVGKTTLVADTRRWRDRGFSLEFIVKATLKPEEAPPTTALGWVEKFCYGSPKYRALLKLIRMVCLEKDSKLMVTEGNVLNATIIEELCNYLHIECAVMHSGLSSSERVALAKRFRQDPKPTKLKVLVIMYDVTGLGIDLYEFCCDVGVFSPGKNGLIEQQAVCRVVRAPQTKWVRIYRLAQNNSHDEYRNSRQMDKYLVQLASRLNEPTFREELLKCLEVERQAVIELAKTPDGIKIMLSIKSGQAFTMSREFLEDDVEDEDEEMEDPAGMGDGHVEVMITDDMDMDDDEEPVIPIPTRKSRVRERDPADRFEQDEALDELVRRLKMDVSRPFMDADLEKDEVIQLGLSLIYKKHLGAQDSTYRSSVHILYSQLSEDIQEALRISLANVPKNLDRMIENDDYDMPMHHIQGPIKEELLELPDFNVNKVFTTIEARCLVLPKQYGQDRGFALYEAMDEDEQDQKRREVDICFRTETILISPDYLASVPKRAWVVPSLLGSNDQTFLPYTSRTATRHHSPENSRNGCYFHSGGVGPPTTLSSPIRSHSINSTLYWTVLHNQHISFTFSRSRSATVKPPAENDGRPKKQCPKCGRHILISELAKHTKISHGPKDVPCRFEGCGSMFRTNGARYSHEMTHGKLQHFCEVPQCTYAGAHRFQGLLQHVRHSHAHIAAAYVKGNPIPWDAPQLQIQFAMSNTKASKSPAPQKVDVALVQPFQDEDMMDQDETEENELLQGFNPDMQAYVRDYNQYIQNRYSQMAIYTPRSKPRNLLDGVRMCSGTDKAPCAYNVPINLETAALVPQERRAKDAKGMIKVLILRSRCLLCTRTTNRANFHVRLQKVVDGVPICSQSASCNNPRLPGRLQCQQCADAWNVTALEREKADRIKRSIRFGLGSQVTDAESMQRSLEGMFMTLDSSWTDLTEAVRQRPDDVFVVDTESGYMGDQDIHEVGVVNYEGGKVLDAPVDHGCTIAEYYDKIHNSVTENMRTRAHNGLRKTYGPPSLVQMPGLTPREIILKLKDGGMTNASIWVEHSIGSFDYRRLKALCPPDLAYILPDPKNIYSTLELWRELMPGLYSHKLSQIYSLVRPGDALLDRRHKAFPDAEMCLGVLKVVIEKFEREV
ncbi:hypothetical protein VTL71DRAFT_6000 [Oculimacula yallundae]|uniref:Helicase C-terminal domain-containing protein n=1 Tax=Oculimacula yallundae TaxID=86028 RepID=A0ABR4BZ47_9HELO